MGVGRYMIKKGSKILYVKKTIQKILYRTYFTTFPLKTEHCSFVICFLENLVEKTCKDKIKHYFFVEESDYENFRFIFKIELFYNAASNI